MKKTERLIMILMVLFAAIVFVIYRLYRRTDSLIVNVYHHKTCLQTIDLSQDHRYTFKGDQGTFHLEVANGRYRAIDVDCPNQICVHTGWVKLGDEKAIICAPNGISVVQETETGK